MGRTPLRIQLWTALVAALAAGLAPGLCASGWLRHACECTATVGTACDCCPEDSELGCECDEGCSHDGCETDPCQSGTPARLQDESPIGPLEVLLAELPAVGLPGSATPAPGRLDAAHCPPDLFSSRPAGPGSSLPFPEADLPLLI